MSNENDNEGARPAGPPPPYDVDFAELMRQRLLDPQQLKGDYGRDPAREIGYPVMRQLTRKDSAPGGDKPLRLSSIGTCLRRQAYKRKGYIPSNSINASTKVTFMIGDMVESLALTVLREALMCSSTGWLLAGDRAAGGAQFGVTLNVGDTSIDGHPDGFLGNPDQNARAILEIKSMGRGAYARVSKALGAGEDPWGPGDTYWHQVQSYMLSVNQGRSRDRWFDYAYALVIDRDGGNVSGWWVPREEDYESMVGQTVSAILEADDPADVPRMLPDGTLLEPTVDLHKRNGTPNKGHGCLPWQCAYCPFSTTCWPDAEYTTISNRKALRVRMPEHEEQDNDDA